MYKERGTKAANTQLMKRLRKGEEVEENSIGFYICAFIFILCLKGSVPSVTSRSAEIRRGSNFVTLRVKVLRSIIHQQTSYNFYASEKEAKEKTIWQLFTLKMCNMIQQRDDIQCDK